MYHRNYTLLYFNFEQNLRQIHCSLNKKNIFYYTLTDSLEQSRSWEANRSSGSQGIPRSLWKPKVHYRIHKCPPSVQSILYYKKNCINFHNLEYLCLSLTEFVIFFKQTKNLGAKVTIVKHSVYILWTSDSKVLLTQYDGWTTLQRGSNQWAVLQWNIFGTSLQCNNRFKSVAGIIKTINFRI